jgi:hypothetical protein
VGVKTPASRLILLLVAIAASTALLVPAESTAIPICGYSMVRTYYCDAGLTTYCGTCYWGCDGTSGCWGSITSYYTHNLYECETC